MKLNVIQTPKEQQFNKKLICLSTANEVFGLEKAFPNCQVVDTYDKITALRTVSCDQQPDAVMIFAEDLNIEFFRSLRVTSKVLKRCSVPLIVLANVSDDMRKNILKHGADDCFTTELDPEKLNYWIDFLKLFKKLSTEVSSPQIAPFEVKISRAKRAFDIITSLSALIMLLPVFAAIALVIKIESRGPVFYVAQRAGRGYKIFNFLKFRSMSAGADKELSKLLHLNQYSEGMEIKDNSANPVFFKIKNDPRITRFGNFLRNTSLDELPQLINVLRGDMSIVGNRPLPLYEAQQLTQDQFSMRFMAAAGITGLWQVTKRGRGEMSEQERIELDMLYAQKSNFWYDMSLILKTFPALLQKEKV